MLTILGNGLRFTDTLQYAWFQLQKDERIFYRAIALKELSVIPVDVREDYDLLGKTWAAVRGLHNAGVNFIYAATGIYKPEHIGIVQYYGAAAEADGEEAAAKKAMSQIRAVEAILAGGFPQTRLTSPNIDWFRWYLEFVMTKGQYISSILGHPDPRMGKRGASDGALGDSSDDDLASEQNEILFRGLARLRENFVYQVLAEQVSRGRMISSLLKVAEAASNVASRRKGAISVGFSLSLPLMAALGQSNTGSQAAGSGHTQSVSNGQSLGWGSSFQQSQSSTDGTSHSQSVMHSTGGGQTLSETSSQSHAVGQSHSVSDGQSWGTTDTSGSSSSSGSSHGTTSSKGSSVTNYGPAASAVNAAGQMKAGNLPPAGQYGNVSVNPGSVTQGASLGGSVGASGNGSLGLPGVASLGAGINSSVNGSVSQSETTPNGPTVSFPFGQVTSNSQSAGVSNSVSSSSGSMSSHSVMQGGSRTVTNGTSQTDSVGQAQGISNSQTWSNGEGESWTTTHSQSQGQAWGESQNAGLSHGEGSADSQTLARTLSSGITSGISTGLIPGISIGQSWQVEDDVADRMTEILRQLEGVCNQASAEGGFMTNVWLFTESETGATAADALVPQAFHGTNVPTPVLTCAPEPGDVDQLRAHATTFLPWTDTVANDPFGGGLWTKYATLLTAQMVAAYTAPGLFEEGAASTVMSPIPKGMGFYPAMPGDAVLGHQYSPETGDLTTAQVRVAYEHLMHTAFAGDTGFGKSVAAIRMAYETTLRWKLRTVVLDFGAGWRTLLNAPGLEGHVNILQLWPDAVRPFRWNPLRIGRYLSPETQWRAFADVFGSIAQLGVKRQKQEMLDALRNVYLDAGVLVDDPDVRKNARWGMVDAASWEDDLLGISAGTPIGDLTASQRQILAVNRSSVVGLTDLYKEVEKKLAAITNKRDVMLSGVLEGILFRLNPLVQGTAALQFAPGPDTIPVEDFSKPWGITILEGGMFLDEFGKAFLLGWTGWHLYMDMVARRVHEVNTGEPILQIFYEEANKIFVQDSGGGDDSGSGGMSASQRFSDMFRDARKYLARLHVITQAPSLIAQDIMSSCNNLVVGFLKQPRDKDLVLSAFARSEKGFRDEEWRRFVDDIPIGMAIGRFPYTTRRELQRPFLFRPLMLDVPEPSDEDIVRKLGKINL